MIASCRNRSKTSAAGPSCWSFPTHPEWKLAHIDWWLPAKGHPTAVIHAPCPNFEHHRASSGDVAAKLDIEIQCPSCPLSPRLCGPAALFAAGTDDPPVRTGGQYSMTFLSPSWSRGPIRGQCRSNKRCRLHIPVFNASTCREALKIAQTVHPTTAVKHEHQTSSKLFDNRTVRRELQLQCTPLRMKRGARKHLQECSGCAPVKMHACSALKFFLGS